MDLKTNILTLSKWLEKAEHIAILGHYNPDGDAIGSALALYNFLLDSDKTVKVIVPNDFPENLKWMDGVDQIQIYSMNRASVEAYFSEADLIFCNDFQSFSRVEALEPLLEKSSAKKVLIDHHLSPQLEQFDLVFSTSAVSSTSELLFDVLVELGGIEKINKSIAECLFAGIITDTGSFSYSCNKRTYEIAAQLVDKGIDSREIHENIYSTFSEDRLRLLGFCLSERLKVLPEYSTAYMFLTKADLDKFNYVSGDTEGIVNYALSMQKVKFAAFFTERETRIRISFRSKGDLDTNDFAKTYFDGGGHRNASGGNSSLSIEETLARFESLLPEFKKKNNL